MEQINPVNRDYNTISPSAKSLVLLKGLTKIPFARQTAELIMYPEKFNPDVKDKDIMFWARVLHFERRYQSIGQLMEEVSVSNILELSSGFSFRSLETARRKGFYYIDTDLPDVITTKKDFVTALKGENIKIEGTLELLPLNALDKDQFLQIVEHFPNGEVVIVNEGLLMYLDTEEKEKLCSIIYEVLKKRGGYWITADIYIKRSSGLPDLKVDNKTKDFFEQHRIEDNKFGSFEEAESFFRRMGFIIDKEATVNRSTLSSLKFLLKYASVKQLFKMRKAGKMQATWRLKVVTE